MKKFVTMIISAIALMAVMAVPAMAEEVGVHYASDKDSIQNESGTFRSEVRYGVLNASAGANAESRLGAVDERLNGDNDGNGIAAIAHAEASVAEVGMTVTAGSEDYNVKCSTDISALAAAASAGVGATIKDGKVTVGAEVGAEANLVDVKGKVGGTVGGVEMGVEAGVKVGVAAKAQAGYTDGKLSAGVDVALGVGFSVKTEVDISAVTNALPEPVDVNSLVMDSFPGGAFLDD